ncbi:MAG: cytochrome c oxidase subunit I, partial [Planctomycetaceae bacterium]|nr:cytochrome c oxidase subunit I [Planctomycetaceae bacterium]
MSTATPTAEASHGHGHHDHAPDKLALLKKIHTFSTDHKVIGVQFLITTMLLLFVGGALALGVRWQLAFPWETMPLFGKLFAQQGGQISPEFYTMLFT